MNEQIVIARDLVKTYDNGRTRALDGVSWSCGSLGRI
jgi:hypothetical protein